MFKYLRNTFCTGALALGCLHAGQALAIPMLHLEAVPTTPVVGSSFEVNLIGEDFLDLYAFNFSLSYDPVLIRAVSVDEGTLLPSAGTTFFISGFIDDTIGSITFTGDSLLGTIAGANGSGSLATIRFEALAPGISGLTLSDLLFLDSGLTDIAIAAEDSRISILGDGGNSVPEPASLALVFAGLWAFAVARRHRSTNLAKTGQYTA